MLLALVAFSALTAQDWAVFSGGSGPGKGKHIVLLAGDEEYRSEEGLPQLAKILSTRHGFKCTVLFSINEKGEIDPNVTSNQPGLEALAKADLCIMLLRFRCWPDSQMKHFADYLDSGKPIIALRTSTHAFNYPADSTSPYRRFGWQSKDWPGGFGKQVLGENWVSHWGNHGSQATKGIVSHRAHPILNGVKELFGNSDVYEAAPPPDAQILVWGQVLLGMSRGDAPARGKKKTAQGIEQDINAPKMPIVWVRGVGSVGPRVPSRASPKTRIVTTTMGAATDLQDEGLRRLLINASYWTLTLPVPAHANVAPIGDYKPTMFGFNGFKKGVKPSELLPK
ncbi:MAG: ThuA domain-containing protein [Chlorobia bacterium]|nr:ThuA domain-containing protein [Fimbriimonadaceae bacterium]